MPVMYFTNNGATYDYPRSLTKYPDPLLPILGFVDTLPAGAVVENVSGGKAPVSHVSVRGANATGQRAGTYYSCNPANVNTALVALIGQTFVAAVPGAGGVTDTFTIDKARPKNN